MAEKKRWEVTLVFTFADSIKVDAETEDEAEAIAIGKIGYKSVCHHERDRQGCVHHRFDCCPGRFAGLRMGHEHRQADVIVRL